MLGGGSANGVAGFGCHGYGWEAEQGGSAGREGVQSSLILCRGSGQAGSWGRTSSQPRGRFILLGDPWQNLFKCFLRDPGPPGTATPRAAAGARRSSGSPPDSAPGPLGGTAGRCVSHP